MSRPIPAESSHPSADPTRPASARPLASAHSTRFTSSPSSRGATPQGSPSLQLGERLRSWWSSRTQGDRGAVTAEYAVVIMGAVAFAGLLVVILGSEEVRGMLVDLVQRALGSAG